MLASDTIMMVALIGFCVGWIIKRDKLNPKWLFLLAAVAFGASLTSVLQGRWQAAVGGGVSLFMVLCLLIRSQRKKPATRLPILSTLMLLALTAVAYLPLHLLPVFQLPKPTGPHLIGVRSFVLEDSTRTGVMEAAANEPRKLLLRVWYPAQGESESKVPYADADDINVSFAGLASQFGMPRFFFSHLNLVTTNAYPDAPVLIGDQPLPVVYFSHGYMSYGSQNTVLMEQLASHGYITIAVSHPYDAAPILFPDGDVISPPADALKPVVDEDGQPVIPDSQQQFYAGANYDARFTGMLDYFTELRRDDSRLYRSAEVWLNDRLFVSQAMASAAVPDHVSDIVARGDFSRVAHIGMSFGGSTAAALAYEDPRCAAAVNLDGGDYHFRSANRPIPVPLLMLHSDWSYFGNFMGEQNIDLNFGFNDFSYESYSEAGRTENVVRLRVKNVKHIGISDYPLMLRQPVSEILVGSIEPNSMMLILNDFVLGFFDRHLRGIDNGFPADQFKDHAADVVPHDATEVRKWWQSKTSEEKRWLEHRLTENLKQ